MLFRSFRNDLERTIADNECNTYHWTLMHRYHKAADIINEVREITCYTPQLLLLLVPCWLQSGRAHHVM
jgi:hypothetical protein